MQQDSAWGFCSSSNCDEREATSEVQTYNQNLTEAAALTCPSEKHLCSGLNNIVMSVTKSGEEGKYELNEVLRTDDMDDTIRTDQIQRRCTSSGAPLWKKMFSSTDLHRSRPLAVLTGILTRSKPSPAPLFFSFF